MCIDLNKIYKIQKYKWSKLVFEEDDFFTSLAEKYINNTSYKCRFCEKFKLLSYGLQTNRTFYPRWLQSHEMALQKMYQLLKTILGLGHKLLSNLQELLS